MRVFRKVLIAVGVIAKAPGVLIAVALLVLAHTAHALPAKADQTVIVLTSFSEDYVAPIKQAFMKRHPDVRLRFLYKKTPAAVAHILSGRGPVPDVFIASAVDAFESLKASGRLVSFSGGGSQQQGIRDKVILNDRDGFYRGIALSGYGVMWNDAYLSRLGLSAPHSWGDLLQPQYAGHIGLTSPTRSGTTHIIVEMILQRYGWERGWAYLQELAGNLATITARSFGVRDGVLKERFGLGLVVDFFALGPRYRQQPVAFSYLDETTLVPASGAMIRGGANPKAALTFLNFLTSLPGQELLRHPDLMRLPVRADAYRVFPDDFPNPFVDGRFVETRPFDRALSSRRYHLVNAMFDRLITYRLHSLREAWGKLHALEGREEASIDHSKLREARRVLTSVPVGAMMAADDAFLSQFSRVQPGVAYSSMQTRLDVEWKRYGDHAIKQAEQLLQQAVPVEGKSP